MSPARTRLSQQERLELGQERPTLSLREARFSQSLERGLAVLSCFTAERPMRGIADLAEELGMSRSTTHRYVITLVALGYLEQGPSRKYRLGLRVTDLGMSALSSMSLREHAHPYIQELRREANFTVNLAILDGGEILYLDRVRGSRQGQHKIDLDLHVGSRLPAYCTAMGKLLLANLPEEEQRAVITALETGRCGPNAIETKKRLREALPGILEDGFATNDEESAKEVQAIAAPVRCGRGEAIAAVGLVAPRSTITVEELADALSSNLLATAARISARLGYRRVEERP